QVQKLFAEQKNIGVSLAGVLADRLHVDPRVETAVETLFGPYLEAVVVESITDAKRVSAWLNSNKLGRTAMIVLPQEDEIKAHPDAGGETIADHLGISETLAGALREIFPREMSARLVEDLDNAKAAVGEILIDLRGELLIGGRMVVAGNRVSAGRNDSLLAFKRELRGLEKECDRLARDIDSATLKVEQSRAILIDAESKTVDLQSLIIKVDRGAHGLQIRAHTAREDIARAERHLKVVAEDIAQIQMEIAESNQKLSEAVSNKNAAEIARSVEAASLEDIAKDLGRARVHADEANAFLNEKRMAAATSAERRRSVQLALRRVENERDELEERFSFQNLELSDAENKIKELHLAINEIADRIASAGDHIASENDELAAAIERLNKGRETADQMSADLADLNRRAANARNERAEIEIRQAETKTRLQNTSENCQQELNISLVDLVQTIEADEDLVLDDARREVDSLRERLDGFGAINMLALEELGEAEERHLFLTSQRQDIIDSIAATEEALREIKQRSRERFKSAFEAINENFVEFFHELFGGGRGEMTLLESDDILEAGIEVVAQPPGKRLQNILLLSGGEKAMTAIALVLAIFKYRPSPFCLLDEVDAPLDDANVGRFAGKIAEMSEKTQFIVITHNKRTMEAARALYGVTMQEAGVSKIVSVKFE
ncbi:MAG TPA: hypothetical protein VNA17_06545, partial [Pyrinomonadaceae bacterium]|nr:hypothetical protein [Pyrinomonadaceae bacterium]